VSAHVIDRQIDAYNRRDLDGFVACYAPATVVEDATGGVLMQGQDAIRHAYGGLFQESPDLHAEIAKRIEIGEYVIDEELVTGRRGAGEALHAVVVYHVADGLIDHVRLIQ
jgi:hypothetical protein